MYFDIMTVTTSRLRRRLHYAKVYRRGLHAGLEDYKIKNKPSTMTKIKMTIYKKMIIPQWLSEVPTILFVEDIKSEEGGLEAELEEETSGWNIRIS